MMAVAPGAVLLPEFALAEQDALWAGVQNVVKGAPFRRMVTPGGFRMSVAMTNCGALGWVTDRAGYRYTACDPESGLAWPEMPSVFRKLATRAADEAGFAGFAPDACLINRYEAEAKMSLHQDKNEVDYSQPIVSVSLGLPATFLFGGMERSDRAARVKLHHGDVVVWGGDARLRFHGIAPLKSGEHAGTGECRINLTFRVAG